MDQTTLLYVMTAFVIIAAIALCIQAAMLVAVSRTTKSLHDTTKALHDTARSLTDKITPLLPKVESLVMSTQATVEQGGRHIAEITTKANQILESTKHQLAMVEEVVTEATSRAKVQMERVELVLDDTVSRAHETVATIHGGIMRPLREINGVAAGIKTALGFLARSTRPSVDRATSDEEMFI